MKWVPKKKHTEETKTPTDTRDSKIIRMFDIAAKISCDVSCTLSPRFLMLLLQNPMA
jgi:hypothetical protein